MLDNLVKGYVVKKHSPSTTVPHDKFMYISPDHRFLCWKSLDKQDEKMMELRKVETIVIGRQVPENIKSSTLKKYERSFVVKSSIRDLEIECSNEG